METKFPSSICIFGEWISIKYVEDIDGDREEYLHGDFCEVDNVIRIRKAKPEWMFRVLIHELTHAVIAKSAWDEVLKDKEEGICKLFEHFSQILSLNPSSKAVKWKQPRCDTEKAHHIRKRRNAHKKVAYAVRTGKLTRPTECEDCGKECKPQGHHHLGYDKPLEVVWLCQSCHNTRHKNGENHV